jgi:hypothetical protein
MFKSLRDFFKFILGAILCTAVAWECVEPFLKRRINGQAWHPGFAEGFVAIIVFSGIAIMFLISICVTGMCLYFAIRSVLPHRRKEK